MTDPDVYRMLAPFLHGSPKDLPAFTLHAIDHLTRLLGSWIQTQPHDYSVCPALDDLIRHAAWVWQQGWDALLDNEDVPSIVLDELAAATQERFIEVLTTVVTRVYSNAGDEGADPYTFIARHFCAIVDNLVTSE